MNSNYLLISEDSENGPSPDPSFTDLTFKIIAYIIYRSCS